MRECPFCTEKINDKAIKCKHCGAYTSRWDRIIHSAITPIATGILIGFMITIFGQIVIRSEDKHTTKLQHLFLTSLLKNELILNYKRLQTLDKWASIERDATKSGSLMTLTILPFPKPSFEAWNIVRFDKSNYLNNINPEFQQALNKLYFTLEEVDNRVVEREERITFVEIENVEIEKKLSLLHNLDSNIHVSIYSVKSNMLEVAKHLLPEEDIEENLGKLLWK